MKGLRTQSRNALIFTLTDIENKLVVLVSTVRFEEDQFIALFDKSTVGAAAYPMHVLLYPKTQIIGYLAVKLVVI